MIDAKQGITIKIFGGGINPPPPIPETPTIDEAALDFNFEYGVTVTASDKDMGRISKWVDIKKGIVMRSYSEEIFKTPDGIKLPATMGIALLSDIFDASVINAKQNNISFAAVTKTKASPHVAPGIMYGVQDNNSYASSSKGLTKVTASGVSVSCLIQPPQSAPTQKGASVATSYVNKNIVAVHTFGATLDDVKIFIDGADVNAMVIHGDLTPFNTQACRVLCSGSYIPTQHNTNQFIKRLLIYGKILTNTEIVALTTELRNIYPNT